MAGCQSYFNSTGHTQIYGIKSSLYAPDSFLNPKCRNQYPNTVMYYGESCKTSSGPLFKTDISSLHLWSISPHSLSQLQYHIGYLITQGSCIYLTGLSLHLRFGRYSLYTTTVSTNKSAVMIYHHPEVHVILLSDQSIGLACLFQDTLPFGSPSELVELH